MKRLITGAVVAATLVWAAPSSANAAEHAVYRPGQDGVGVEAVGYRIPRAAVNRSFRQLDRRFNQNVRSFQRDVRQLNRSVSRFPTRNFYAPRNFYSPAPRFHYAPRNAVQFGGFGIYW